MWLEALKYFVLFMLIRLGNRSTPLQEVALKLSVFCSIIFKSLNGIYCFPGTFGAIVDDSRDEEHPQGLMDNTKNGWKLIIYPQTQPNINILLKRVDDTLNL